MKEKKNPTYHNGWQFGETILIFERNILQDDVLYRDNNHMPKGLLYLILEVLYRIFRFL